MQTESSNNATQRITRRTTWMVFADCKYTHHINKKEKQRQTKAFQQNTQTTEQTYGNITNNKQQTHTLYVIEYKQTQTQQKTQTYKQAKTTNK